MHIFEKVFRSFLVDTSIPENIKFISYHLIFITFQERKQLFYPSNAGLFQNFNVIEI